MTETNPKNNYSFYGRWEKEPAVMVAEVKEFLDGVRDTKLESEQRAQAVSGTVMGITQDGLEIFIRRCGLARCDKPMGWVISNICKPLCEAQECELVELFMGVMLDKQPVVRPATWFFSYTWGVPFSSTVKSIMSNSFSKTEKDVKSTRAFWWDLFCQNQHIVKNVQGTFDAAVDQATTLALSIPNPSDPIAITRIWCLFEVMSALSKEKKIMVFCDNSDKMVRGSQIPEINCLEANATVAADKTMILGLIEERIPGGTKALDEQVFKVLRDGLVQALIVRGAAAAVEAQKEAEANPKPQGEYDYLTYTETKKLILKAGAEHKENIRGPKEALIAYALEAGIKLPSEEEVAKLKAEARAKDRAKRAAGNMENFRRRKGKAVASTSWI